MNLNESQTTRCYEDARSQRASGLSALIVIVVVVFIIAVVLVVMRLAVAMFQ